jgi:hypothetical protein
MAELDVEEHLVDKFKPAFLPGLHGIRDYNIDLTPSRMMGHIDGLTFPLYAHATPKFQRVTLFPTKRMVIPGRATMPIPVNAACSVGTDYVFTPYTKAEPSIPAAPQMARGVMDSNSRFIMFPNHSEHPVGIDKRQVLGAADAVLFGSVEAATRSVIRWDGIT